MSLFHPNILDFVDFEPAENVRKIQLHLWGSSIKQILQTLKKWRQLHHLTIMDFYKQSRPRFKVLCDFIMDMKHLTHLHLTLNSAGSNYDKLKSLQEKVTKFALTNRPNLKFVIH